MATLLIYSLVMTGCSTLTKGVGMIFRPRASDVLTVILRGGGIHYDGSGRNYRFSFSKNGEADKDVTTFKHDYPMTGVVSTRGRGHISEEQFYTLARLIVDNGFFSKSDPGWTTMDGGGELTVTTSFGEIKINTALADKDPEFKAIVDAVWKLTEDVQWDETSENQPDRSL